MKRTIYDVTSVKKSNPAETELRWQIAKLELKFDELLDAIKPFAEADIESETLGHFAKAKAVYEKYRK